MQGPFVKALAISFSAHIIIALVLVLADFSSLAKPTPTASNAIAPPKPIKAVVVDKKSIEKQLNKIREKDLAKKRKKAAEEKARKDRIRNAALAKKRKQEQAKRKREEELRKSALAKKKKAAEEKRRREAEAKRKKKAEEEKRKRQEAERKRRAKKEREEQERQLAEQMAQEMAARTQARQQQVMSELGRYTALITHIIQSNLLTDQATMEGKSCKLNITLAASGFVIDVSRQGGDRVVCDAARNAVKKAGTLPVSKDPEVFEKMRSISLTVVPEF